MRNLGCYKDSTRPLDKIYKNVRNDIDWFDMKKTVMDCAKAAKEKGYKVCFCFLSHTGPTGQRESYLKSSQTKYCISQK